MTPARFHYAILRSAAFLVPAEQRTDWLAEWRSELWHAQRESHGLSPIAFCMGAFRDAFWLWRDDPCPDSFSLTAESPARCLAWLAGLGALLLAFGLLVPAARNVLLCALYPGNLVMLHPAHDGNQVITDEFFSPYHPVSRERFDALSARDGTQFSGLAFYVPMSLPFQTPTGPRTLVIAKTTANLFQLLNVPIPQGHAGRPTLVLTRTAWQKYFNGDPQYGSISDNQWHLPGAVDGWLIEDDAARAALPASTTGFVLARLRYGSLNSSQFDYIRLDHRLFEPLWFVLPLFLLSCGLFAVMMYGQQGGQVHQTSLRKRLFLGAKILLVLPVSALCALDLLCLGGKTMPLMGNITMFATFLAARWALADQRDRCPVCLRLLANPVRFGGSSRILLEWHGTELMCVRGHGLLYVSEWPTVWSSRRWMDLGSSWAGLFH